MKNPKTMRKTAVLGLIALAVSTVALATPLAPTATHPAGRASDTGFQSVTNLGRYSAAVPLDLPAARGGLSIPLSIFYDGSRRIGVAGLGWQVPLSYVRVDSTVAHGRPKYEFAGTPKPREQVTVSLAGETIAMVPSNVHDVSGTTWVARDNAMDLVLVKAGSEWVLRDGNAQEMVFATEVDSNLAEMWLLTSITSSTNALEIQYQIQALPIPGNTSCLPDCLEGFGIDVDIVGIRYNVHPEKPKCFKNEVALQYGQPRSEPWAVSLLDWLPLTRRRTLTSIDVLARESCDSAGERLRRYELEYDADPDTDGPRLRSVWMTGREGTPQAQERLPVRKFEYGAVAGGTTLTQQSIALPINAIGTSAPTPTASTETSSSGSSTSWRDLVDVTGDGRPDLVFPKINQLWVAPNVPSNGETTFGTPLQLTDSVFTVRSLSAQTGTVANAQTLGNLHSAYNQRLFSDTWRRTVDVNADGRMDVIDAREQTDTWVIYLNTPGNPVTWVRIELSVAGVRAKLEARGHVLSDDYLPLSRQSTGADTRSGECWEWSGAPDYKWKGPVDWALCTATDNQEKLSGDKTITDWDITDVNGDGYPDFVFADTPAAHTYWRPPLTSEDDSYGWYDNLHIDGHFVTREFKQHSGGVSAFLNIAGVRLGHEKEMFSHEPNLLVSSSKCGVAMWEDDQAGTQTLVCGLDDVNGDRLADRIERDGDDLMVTLGYGPTIKTAGNQHLTMKLPGPIEMNNPREEACDNDGVADESVFLVKRWSGLRDLTGDGIPDYVGASGSGWGVWIGTGVGFRPPTAALPAYPMSWTRETCAGGTSETVAGLYDLDGDGRADYVQPSDTDSSTWVVQKFGAPLNAGLLTAIDNGYGAKTTIEYGSAKEDATTKHDVPFPEIVVSSVQTTGQHDLGGTLHAVRYAYGDAEQFFDPYLDRFTIRAYGRSVAVYGTGTKEELADHAVVRDTEKLQQFVLTSDEAERFARYRRVGRVSKSYVLRDNVPADPWALLATYPGNSHASGQHTEWASRLVQTWGPRSIASIPEDCVDVMFPYNWDASLALNQAGGFYGCQARGLTYARNERSWTGTKTSATTAYIETGVEVLEIDDLGRQRTIKNVNDTARSDDDVCIETTYATPSIGARVLFAPSTRRVTTCPGADGTNAQTLALENLEYDALPVGQLAAGNLTSRVVTRFATDTGQNLGTIREFEASYDTIGNPIYIVNARPSDGAVRSVEITYDPFGLAVVATEVTASGVASLGSETVVDPVSLQVLGGTDANGASWSRSVDGYGRETSKSVSPSSSSGAPSGVVSATSYENFTDGISGGRTISTKLFSDPVPDSSYPGRTTTAMLDELGRTRRVESDLGADYVDKALISIRQYDELGRIHFESDPYPRSQDESPVYGTTFHFGPDGALKCSIRGNGPQPLTQATNTAQEIFPTCVSRLFANRQLTTYVTSPDSTVAGTTQAGVIRADTVTAIGRSLSSETTKSGSRLELSTHSYDRLGQLIALTRYQDPVNAGASVTWSWRYDSRGNVLSATEPAMATRSFTYSEFGELVSANWTDSTGGSPVNKQLAKVYDALGRVTASYELEQGQVLPDTVYEWVYDQPDPAAPFSTSSTYGRLTATKSPIGHTYLSYDGFGRVDRRGFYDPTQDETYFEGVTTHFDGSLSRIEHVLPDGGAEAYGYDYDSAGRLRKVIDETTQKPLYTAYDIDPFGRVLAADYGTDEKIHALATFAMTGRRLPVSSEVQLDGGDKRIITFDAFDAVGRELTRTEQDDLEERQIANTYDALGQLVAQNITVLGQSPRTSQFEYDALGNLTRSVHVDGTSTSETNLMPDLLDRDRICRVTFGAGSSGPCNTFHDALGNVIQQPTRTGTRTLTFYPSGAVKEITEGQTSAAYRYDGSGQIWKLDVFGQSDPREDRVFGPFTRRKVDGDTIIVRNIPGAGGTLATRRGKEGPLVFSFAEARGLRSSALSDAEKFVQDASYLPYGETNGRGAKPADALYTNHLWNGGDLLADLGVVQLGARVYDPVVGRFLSRDPLMIPRSASAANPYSFSYNDPINFSDPTGLCGQAENEQCPLPWGGGLGGGGGTPYQNPELVSAPSGPVGYVQLWSSEGELLDVLEVDKWRQGRDVKNLPRNWQERAYGVVVGGLTAAGGYGLAVIGAAMCVGSMGGGCGVGLTLMMIGADFAQSGTNHALSGEPSPLVGEMYGGSWVGDTERAALTVFGLGAPIYSVWSAGRPAPSCYAAGTCASRTGGPALPSGGCFAAGTRVHTEHGLSTIEQVTAGDLVWARDEVTGEIALRHVVRTFVKPDQPVVEVRLRDDEGSTETFRATNEHPFWTQRGWVAAHELQGNDHVLRRTGTWLYVASVEETGERETVYNFEVERFHTYFVGDFGAFVHNNSTFGGGSRTGEFSVIDWTGYPSGLPRPTGPFRLLEGPEYEAARAAANRANAALRAADPAKYAGKQIHEIHPVKFGGSPTDLANKAALPPPEHAPYTTFWNRLMWTIQ